MCNCENWTFGPLCCHHFPTDTSICVPIGCEQGTGKLCIVPFLYYRNNNNCCFLPCGFIYRRKTVIYAPFLYYEDEDKDQSCFCCLYWNVKNITCCVPFCYCSQDDDYICPLSGSWRKNNVLIMCVGGVDWECHNEKNLTTDHCNLLCCYHNKLSLHGQTKTVCCVTRDVTAARLDFKNCPLLRHNTHLCYIPCQRKVFISTSLDATTQIPWIGPQYAHHIRSVPNPVTVTYKIPFMCCKQSYNMFGDFESRSTLDPKEWILRARVDYQQDVENLLPFVPSVLVQKIHKYSQESSPPQQIMYV